PFDRVIKETELTTSKKTVPPIIKEERSRSYSSTIDSLILTIITIDSVWLSITIDDTTVREYIFPPNIKRTLKAASKFTITAGNAGAVYLRINNKDLGVLGKPGTVIRNKEFTRQILLSQ
ncbi:MAG: DUF4115 domain-containing protein, partial [Bacteroidetes bacterium]|nr:DUF4115 domain-containing protein [Bacteroidota bacterium]